MLAIEIILSIVAYLLIGLVTAPAILYSLVKHCGMGTGPSNMRWTVYRMGLRYGYRPRGIDKVADGYRVWATELDASEEARRQHVYTYETYAISQNYSQAARWLIPGWIFGLIAIGFWFVGERIVYRGIGRNLGRLVTRVEGAVLGIVDKGKDGEKSA